MSNYPVILIPDAIVQAQVAMPYVPPFVDPKVICPLYGTPPRSRNHHSRTRQVWRSRTSCHRVPRSLATPPSHYTLCHVHQRSGRARVLPRDSLQICATFTLLSRGSCVLLERHLAAQTVATGNRYP
ncbi:MAG TPA: hypothetical protein V6D28_20530 [Leptolyngbyaceae cyanobacterium]